MLPFPRVFQYNNHIQPDPIPTVDGYYGIETSSLFSFSTISSTLGNSSPVNDISTFRVYKYVYKGKEYRIPSQPIGAASYKEIYEKGMMYGTDDYGPDLYNSSVNIVNTLQNVRYLGSNNSVYKVRLFKGSVPDYVYSVTNNNPAFNPYTEFETFTYPMYNNLYSSLIPDPVYNMPASDKIQKKTLYAPSMMSRGLCIVQGTNGDRTAPYGIGRARFDIVDGAAAAYCYSQISGATTVMVSVVDNTNKPLWWPVFERII